MSDDALPWHRAEWERVQAAAAAGRLHHALLLWGGVGLGKSRFASRLGAMLLCQHETPAARPCGECRGCHLQAAGSHPDHHRVTVLPDKRSIGIEQIRELQDFLSLTAQFAGHKVVIVDPADALTRNAANTLLKSLEEPPGDTVLALLATPGGFLLPTLRSRCQRVGFAPPPRAVARAWLREHRPGAEADVDAALAWARGAPLAALTLLEGAGMQAPRSLVEALGGLATGRLNPVAVAESWKDVGPAVVADGLFLICLDLMRLARSQPTGNPWPEKLAIAMQRLVESLDFAGLARLLDACLEARRATRTGGGQNVALLLEQLAIGCHGLVARTDAGSPGSRSRRGAGGRPER